MTQRAQNLRDEAQQQARQALRHARRLRKQLSHQLHEHFGDELEELRGTRDRVLRQVGQTSSRVTERLLQDDVRLPQPLRAVLEQVSGAIGRWQEGAGAERSAKDGPGGPGPQPARAARPEHPGSDGETSRARSGGARPRRRRKPSAARGGEEVTVPDGGLAAVPPPRAKRP